MSESSVFVGHELLVADAETLLRALPIDSGKVRSRRLFSSPDVTVLGVAMDAGAVMREHVTAVPLLVQVVEGTVVFEVRRTRIELPAGGMLHIDARVRHAVEALVPTRFLLLLLGQSDNEPDPSAA